MGQRGVLEINAVIGLTCAAALLAVGGCSSGSGSGSGSGSDSGGTQATAAASGPASRARISVVTSTDVYGDIARTVGGERVEVTSIISGIEIDPHSYEATGRDHLAVRNADLVVTNGGGYDAFLDRLLEAADDDRPVLTAVAQAHHEDEGAAGLASSPAPHDHGESGNEHVWYDLKAMNVLASAIAEALSTLDPEHTTEYGTNAGAFRDALQELRKHQLEIRAEHNGTPVAVTEPLPLFLLVDSGLVNTTPSAFAEAIEEGIDAPARVLQETLALFADHTVQVLISNSQTTGPQTERVQDAAEDAGIPVVPMTETLPPGKDYLSWMRANLDALHAALQAALDAA